MESLKDILWPVVVVGGLGAFIDFLIGTAGQEKAKTFLLKWWVRFDDVRWNNFGQEEGLFAGQLIERWFGRRIWSVRRLGSALSLYISFLLVGYFKGLLYGTRELSCYYCHFGIYITLVSLIVPLAGFCISMSVTKFATVPIVLAINDDIIVTISAIPPIKMRYQGITTIDLVIALVLLFQSTLITAISSTEFLTLVDTLYPTWFFEFVNYRGGIDQYAFHVLESFSPLFRFGLSLLFVGSFVLRPLIMRPLSFVWARIIESDKPVFTLIFGGAAAFATAISEATKHL